MITVAESIPRKSSNYLLGQDVVWSQFNDIDFYVEDKDQHNFYLEILKRMFPDIKIRKIFPIGGKPAMLIKAKRNLKNKKKVFILDKDFDDLLNQKVVYPNTFYLDRYSIENYLLEEKAIFEIIKEDQPKITWQEFRAKFDFKLFLKQCSLLLCDLTCSFFLIQKHRLGVGYYGLDPRRDLDYIANPICVKISFLNAYYQSVESALKTKINKRYTLSAQIKQSRIYFRNTTNLVSHTPGKYILNILKSFIEKLFRMKQIAIDAFTYRLAKNSKLESLGFLERAIKLYVQ